MPTEEKNMANVQSTLVTTEGEGTLEIFSLPNDTDFLLTLLTDIFDNYWDKIHFGPHMQGAVWEVRAPNKPKRISLLDGYLTVDFGHWHFHLCIGINKGTQTNPSSDTLAKNRCTERVELYRRLMSDGKPSSWGLRMYNGGGDQQMTVFLPSPYLTVEQKPLTKPDFTHLEMWDHLRCMYLGLSPDPLDRQPSRQICS